MENPIKMDDLGVPLFLETSILVTAHVARCKIQKPIQHPKIDLMVNLDTNSTPSFPYQTPH